jgi:MFS family permease
MVARAYETGSRRTALGTYNFSGDLGKVAVPAAVALALPWLGWRGAVEVYGIVGLVAAAVILVLLGRLGAGLRPPSSPPDAVAERAGGSGIRDVRAFTAISAIHVIDNSTRTGFLTFLPFLLIAKGATVPSVGLALMLVFIGGAVGKFACGALADRVGVIRTVVVTELVTGAGILFLLTLPLGACLVALPVLGVALNGTSSVLYGSVADLVSSERRARSYAIFYTLGIGASALSPFGYGLLSDWGGVRLTLTVVGCVVFLTLPFTLPLRAAPSSAVAAPRSA